jgi:hypothetical protein
MGRLLSLFIVLAAIGCETSTAPLPREAVQFNPPAVYTRWWSLTQECSGLTGDLAAIRWYVVPNAGSLQLKDGSSVNGYYLRGSNRIVLDGTDALSGDLVRHEMLHALLRGPASGPSHPREMFIRRCQGVVVCVDACTTDDGPAPPPDPAAIHVPQDDVTVSIDIQPANPSSAQDGGNFMMIITATNQLGVPIIADIQQCFLCALKTFSFRFDRTPSGGESSYDMLDDYPEQRRFAVGESKRFIFDFRNRDGETRYNVAPGTYMFAGAYGGRWTLGVPVTVSP